MELKGETTMKKFFAMMLTVVMMMSMFMMAALACDGCSDGGVYFSGVSNVRTGPGLSYASIGQVDEGSTLGYMNDVSYDNRGVKWYRVSFGNTTGWVSSKYASLTDSTGIAIYAAGANASGNYVASKNYGSTVYASGNSNVRTGPGLSYPQVGGMEQGETARFLGGTSVDNRGVTWYNVSVDGVTGWVSSAYTTVY
jgi:uncharacterized protein YraI